MSMSNSGNSCIVHYDPAKRVWSGPKGKDYYGKEMTVGEVAMRILKLNANKVVQVDDPKGVELTGGQIALQASIITQALRLKLGLRRGDVIGISASNTTLITGVVIASLLCGCPINALHPDFDQETVKFVYDITAPKVIFCDVENYLTIDAVNQQFENPAEIYLVNGHIKGVHNVTELMEGIDELIEDEINYYPCPELTGDNTAFIICSSGTTGMPKGVTRSHSSFLSSCKNPTLYSRNTIVFTFSPLYWISGIFIFLTSLLNGCKRIITNRPYSVEYLLEICAKHRVTFVLCATHQIALLTQSSDLPNIREQLATVKMLIGAGSKICKAVVQRMYDLIGTKRFMVGYGLSEIGGVSKNIGGPLGSEGKVMRNLELQVLDKLGMALGINEEGIIYARLRYKWAGYYRNPVATMKATSKDGQWLRTGDLGYLDSEGYLYIRTRDTDVFKSYNFQIYPEQIEEYILRLRGVSEACVFGIPHPISTNLTACAVVRSKRCIDGDQVLASDVREIVERNLNSAYHLHGGVYFVDQLPKTSNDKLQRRKVLNLITSLAISPAK